MSLFTSSLSQFLHSALMVLILMMVGWHKPLLERILLFSVNYGNSCECFFTTVKRCVSVVTSDNSKSGNFSSPNYPRFYPQNTHCRYDFVGHANERVQIVFTDFNLFHPDDGFTQRDPEMLTSLGGSMKQKGFKDMDRRVGAVRGRELELVTHIYFYKFYKLKIETGYVF